MLINQEKKTIHPAALITQQQSTEPAGDSADEAAIDATLQDGFPASDPPAWTPAWTPGVEKTAPMPRAGNVFHRTD
jgi:hypothetical protein